MSDIPTLQAHADSLARIYTSEAVGFLVQAMRGEIEGIKPSERLRAAEHIIERGHGKAVQAVITVPARQALASKLYALSDDELLRIAVGGSTQRKGDPTARADGGGSIQAANSLILEHKAEEHKAEEHKAEEHKAGGLEHKVGEKKAKGKQTRAEKRLAEAEAFIEAEFTEGYDPTA